MPACNGCGGHVSERYCAVFGDQDDVVHACHNCLTHVDVRKAASDPALAERLRDQQSDDSDEGVCPA